MALRNILMLPAVFVWLTLAATPSFASSIMYAGLGGHSNGDSTNDGSLGITNQTTGVVTIVGHPAGVSRITGLAFDSVGNLFGTTLGAGGFPPPPAPTSTSNLIRIDPNTGALISSLPITAGGVGISIADLATQPGTNTIYGIRGPQDQANDQGFLYTINPITGIATLIGSTGDFFGSIAFAPNGTLYMSSADLDANDNLINIGLKTLNPSTAATLSFVPMLDFFGALAVRPDDSRIFGGTGDSAQLFTINPLTGIETLVGSTGRNFVGDFAFTPVPEPGTLGLLALGLFGIAAHARRPSSKQDRRA
jgi:PEP-CTERM motif